MNNPLQRFQISIRLLYRTLRDVSIRLYEFRMNIEPPLENSILISTPIAWFLAVIPDTNCHGLDHEHNYPAGYTMSFVRSLMRYVSVQALNLL